MQKFNWNDLKYFLEVARIGTLSGAAHALKTDHATVSRRIGQLEHGLAVALFHRHRMGYELTPDGERLFSHAAEMEQIAEKAQESFGQANANLTGTVRLSTTEGFGNHFLAARLGEFAQEYPQLTLELITLQQISEPSPRQGDVTVTFRRPDRGRFVVERLTDCELCLYASKLYLDQVPSIKRRLDLKHHRFIGYVDDFIISPEFDYPDEVRPIGRVLTQASGISAQLAATLNAQGLCILPRYVAQPFPDLVAVLPEEIKVERTYWMISHEGTSELPRIKALRKFLKKCVSANPIFTR